VAEVEQIEEIPLVLRRFAERLKGKRPALDHVGLAVHAVPPRERDKQLTGLGAVLIDQVATQHVAANDVRLDEKGRGLHQVGAQVTGDTVARVEARELFEHRDVGIGVVVLEQFDPVDRSEREK
jgi:hypothetical protein